jgi:hypothetical protein
MNTFGDVLGNILGGLLGLTIVGCIMYSLLKEDNIKREITGWGSFIFGLLSFWTVIADAIKKPIVLTSLAYGLAFSTLLVICGAWAVSSKTIQAKMEKRIFSPVLILIKKTIVLLVFLSKKIAILIFYVACGGIALFFLYEVYLGVRSMPIPAAIIIGALIIAAAIKSNKE